MPTCPFVPARQCIRCDCGSSRVFPWQKRIQTVKRYLEPCCCSPLVFLQLQETPCQSVVTSRCFLSLVALLDPLSSQLLHAALV
jgi:hypothetical protein